MKVTARICCGYLLQIAVAICREIREMTECRLSAGLRMSSGLLTQVRAAVKDLG